MDYPLPIRSSPVIRREKVPGRIKKKLTKQVKYGKEQDRKMVVEKKKCLLYPFLLSVPASKKPHLPFLYYCTGKQFVFCYSRSFFAFFVLLEALALWL